ncbi:MAG: hypothetical protein AB1644_13145 [Candidatus Zixiibacteriota bacterium]
MNVLRAVCPALLLVLLFVCGTGGAYEPPESVAREYAVYHLDNKTYLSAADSIVVSTRRRLIALIRDSLDYRPDIYVVGDLAYFQSLIGGGFPDWGAAAAVAPLRRIVIKSPDRFRVNRSLGELLAHEYTHLVVEKRTGFYRPPRWFDEGMAMTMSMEWSWSDNLAMSQAAVFGQFINLNQIDNVNRFGEGKAHVAYATSYLALEYFVRQYGLDAVNRFLDEIARGKSVDSALIISTGATESEFDQDLRAALSSRFNITSLFMDTVYFWTALAILVVVGAYLKWRKRRTYYKKWRDEEKFESTDFDYGDPDRPEQTDDEEPWRS